MMVFIQSVSKILLFRRLFNQPQISQNVMKSWKALLVKVSLLLLVVIVLLTA